MQRVSRGLDVAQTSNQHLTHISRSSPRKLDLFLTEELFRQNNIRTFSLSQMSKVKLASTLPWREKVGWNPTNNYYRQKNKRTKYLDDKYVFLLETLRASSPVSSNQTYLCFTKQSSSKNCHHQSTKPSLVFASCFLNSLLVK